MTPNESTPDDADDRSPYELSSPTPAPKPPPDMKYPEVVEAAPVSPSAPAPTHAVRSAQPPIDDSEVARLLQNAKSGGGSNPQAKWKNWRLEGTGFQPIAIYGSLALLMALWLGGACILSAFGPWATLVLLGGLFAVVYRISSNQRLREQREWAGECPKCGYDLRETPTVCPECGTPVPDMILRRRRTEERIRLARFGAPPAPLPRKAPEDQTL